MKQDPGQAPSTAAALETWREAERRAIRSTAQREAAEEAFAAAGLASEAARATAAAADAAVRAATQAARAANATAEAAEKVLRATRDEGEAKRTEERESLDAEVDAMASYERARDRAVERHAPAED